MLLGSARFYRLYCTSSRLSSGANPSQVPSAISSSSSTTASQSAQRRLHHLRRTMAASDKPAFDHERRVVASGVPNPKWRVGEGLTETAPEGADKEVYELFKQSKTKHGQETLFSRIDPAKKEPGDVYKLMIGGIAPRPIGFCSSLDENGVANLAPFSYFQAAGHQPPIVFLSFTVTQRKDTCANIKRTKEFTVNIISEPFIEAANYSSIDAPADVSEWALTGLTKAPSQIVKAPRVAESAYSMECVLEHFYDIYHPDDPTKLTSTCIFGRVKLFHVRTDTLTERGSIDLSRLLPASRLGGITYGRTTDTYDMPRPRYEEERDKPEFAEALKRGDQQLS